MQLRETFDKWARATKQKYNQKQWLLSKWETIEDIRWPEEKVQTMAAHIEKNLCLRANQCLIDLGCGGGWIFKKLSRRSPHAFGLDFSFQMLRCARKFNTGKKFVCAEIARLPFANETFHRALSYFVFINFTDTQYIEKSILEIIRVLKKGGRALIGQLPDTGGSRDYDRAKEDYLSYCRKKYNILEKEITIYRPPIQLFDRKAVLRSLRKKNLKVTAVDSFNPFYWPAQAKTVSWRFDLIIEK